MPYSGLRRCAGVCTPWSETLEAFGRVAHGAVGTAQTEYPQQGSAVEGSRLWWAFAKKDVVYMCIARDSTIENTLAEHKKKKKGSYNV